MIEFRLDNEILDRIVEIEKCRERFGGVKLPVGISSKLRKNSKKKSSYASVKIEGNPLSANEAGEAIESSKRHFLKPEMSGSRIRSYRVC